MCEKISNKSAECISLQANLLTKARLLESMRSTIVVAVNISVAETKHNQEYKEASVNIFKMDPAKKDGANWQLDIRRVINQSARQQSDYVTMIKATAM